MKKPLVRVVFLWTFAPGISFLYNRAKEGYYDI